MKFGFGREGAAAAYAEAGRPSMSTPWLQARWCAIDLELTGLDPRHSEIIAVGAVPIEKGRVVLRDARYALARPSERPERGAVLVHKLRLADLVGAPPVSEAIDLVLSSLTGRVPVFHSAFVERGFLGPQLARRRVRLPPAADTEALGRRWLELRDGSAPPALPLTRLARELGQRGEAPHHALADALMTAQAFIALARHLDGVEPQTVGSLVSVGASAGVGRRFAPG